MEGIPLRMGAQWCVPSNPSLGAACTLCAMPALCLGCAAGNALGSAAAQCGWEEIPAVVGKALLGSSWWAQCRLLLAQALPCSQACFVSIDGMKYSYRRCTFLGVIRAHLYSEWTSRRCRFSPSCSCQGVPACLPKMICTPFVFIYSSAPLRGGSPGCWQQMLMLSPHRGHPLFSLFVTSEHQELREEVLMGPVLLPLPCACRWTQQVCSSCPPMASWICLWA